MKKHSTYFYILAAVLVIVAVGVVLAIVTRSRTSRDVPGNAQITVAPTATAIPTPTAVPTATPDPAEESAVPTAAPDDGSIIEITEDGAEPTPTPSPTPQSTVAPRGQDADDIITVVEEDVSDIDGGLRITADSPDAVEDDGESFGVLE